LKTPTNFAIESSSNSLFRLVAGETTSPAATAPEVYTFRKGMGMALGDFVAPAKIDRRRITVSRQRVETSATSVYSRQAPRHASLNRRSAMTVLITGGLGSTLSAAAQAQEGQL
jgi:hypothetical protein